MTNSEPEPQLDMAKVRRSLRDPATVVILAANLFPLVGLLWWGWDAFLLLMLYWTETGIIAFWTVMQIVLSPRAAIGLLNINGTEKTVSPVALGAFFTLHAGVFMGVHLMFLWAVFSGGWERRTGSVIGFFKHALTTEGLWVPLLILFVGRGIFALAEVVSLRRALRRAATTASAPKPTLKIDSLLLGLYGRIFVMQATIIFGGMIAVFLGSAIPFVLLIVLKSAADLLLPGLSVRMPTAPPESRQAL